MKKTLILKKGIAKVNGIRCKLKNNTFYIITPLLILLIILFSNSVYLYRKLENKYFLSISSSNYSLTFKQIMSLRDVDLIKRTCQLKSNYDFFIHNSSEWELIVIARDETAVSDDLERIKKCLDKKF
jgi:hypothetical protein